MSFFRPDSIKDLLIHLLAAIAVVLSIVVIVFYVWLPLSTNHGETITVPDVKGMTLDELEAFLGKRDLRYVVTSDSSYSPDAKPLSVLRQVPVPNSKVKENRKIYVTINAESPPKVRMPRVEDLSPKSALMTLKSYDLVLGNVKYVPDPFMVVHEGQVNGRTILEGENIEKGSMIDLVIGNGYGNTVFTSPTLIGLELEEAEVVIIGSGLKVGKIRQTEIHQARFTDKDTTVIREIGAGTIQKQFPKPGIMLKIGDLVDLWVYTPDTTINHNSPNLLDNQ